MTVILIAITILLVVFFRGNVRKNEKKVALKDYSDYYVMISEDRESDFYRAVYESALEAAREKDAFVEFLGDNLSQEYSKEDLLRIAIASKVDGIILVADDNDETKELINEATKNDIQVVTLYSDCANSKRISFVGIGSYNLGREYGSRIISIAREKVSLSGSSDTIVNVDVLFDLNTDDSGQSIMMSGIQDVVASASLSSNIVINAVSVDPTNTFSVEGSIRDIFVNTDGVVPDIIVCPNEIDTTSVYQAVVDYNKVGIVNILGYYDSDTILKAIDRNVISATATLDTKQMGTFCIEALNDYRTLGTTSQYFTADITMIDQENVESYMESKVQNED